MKKLKIISIILMCMSGYSWGAGEIFKFNTTGTEYCGSTKKNFNPSHDVDLWGKINNSHSLTLYTDPFLMEPFAMLDLESHMYSSNKASFSAFSGDSYDHIAAVGTFTFDADGYVKSLKASVVRKGYLNNCYSQANVTGKRIN